MYPPFESFIRPTGTITGLRNGGPRNMGSIFCSGKRFFSILTVLSRLLSKFYDAVWSGREIPVFYKSWLLPFLECLFSVCFQFLKKPGNEFRWHSCSLDSVPPHVYSVIFRIILQEHCWCINVWHWAPREHSQANNGYNTPTPRNVNHSMVTCEKTWRTELPLILIEMCGKHVL